MHVKKNHNSWHRCHYDTLSVLTAATGVLFHHLCCVVCVRVCVVACSSNQPSTPVRACDRKSMFRLCFAMFLPLQQQATFWKCHRALYRFLYRIPTSNTYTAEHPSYLWWHCFGDYSYNGDVISFVECIIAENNVLMAIVAFSATIFTAFVASKEVKVIYNLQHRNMTKNRAHHNSLHSFQYSTNSPEFIIFYGLECVFKWTD